MTKPAIRVLRACSLTIALLGSVAVVSAVSLPDMAFAKSGNDGGNGNGGGNGNAGGKGNAGGNGDGNADGGNGNGGANGKSVEKSGAKPVKADTALKTTKARTPIDDLGLKPSELGALNAARANPNALKNAAPNSRVGRIAAYRDAVLEGRELEAELQEKTALFESMTPPDREIAEIEGALAAVRTDIDVKADEVARLEAELAEAGGEDAALQDQLDAAREALTAAQAAEDGLEAELAEAQAYAQLESEIAELESRVEAQPEVERSLLEAAANKPVTDAVEAAVKKLLGL